MTIKEMANNAADVFGGGKWDRRIYADGYADGANAVLNKLKYNLDRIDCDNHTDDDLEDLYDTLYEMIKNFKGE